MCLMFGMFKITPPPPPLSLKNLIGPAKKTPLRIEDTAFPFIIPFQDSNGVNLH